MSQERNPFYFWLRLNRIKLGILADLQWWETLLLDIPNWRKMLRNELLSLKQILAKVIWDGFLQLKKFSEFKIILDDFVPPSFQVVDEWASTLLVVLTNSTS
jgi:hypothetical protein